MIVIKKDDIPELRINNKFDHVVGDQIREIRLYNYIITNIDGDNVTLKKKIDND